MKYFRILTIALMISACAHLESDRTVGDTRLVGVWKQLAQKCTGGKPTATDREQEDGLANGITSAAMRIAENSIMIDIRGYLDNKKNPDDFCYISGTEKWTVKELGLIQISDVRVSYRGYGKYKCDKVIGHSEYPELRTQKYVLDGNKLTIYVDKGWNSKDGQRTDNQVQCVGGTIATIFERVI